MPLASGTVVGYTLSVGPKIQAIPTGVAAPNPTGSGAAVTDPLVIDLIRLFTTDPLQKRPKRNQNSILMSVAQKRAEDMARNNYCGHKDSSGHYINYLLRANGYRLPNWYPGDENSCESAAAGQTTAAEVWAGWLGHPPHRVHVLGEDRFWADQIDYGIGHSKGVAGSAYSDYWVIVTART